MIWKQPDMKGAQGTQLAGTAPAHITTDSGEPVDLQSTTMDPIQRAALDVVYGWLFAPLPSEGDTEGQEAA